MVDAHKSVSKAWSILSCLKKEKNLRNIHSTKTELGRNTENLLRE